MTDPQPIRATDAVRETRPDGSVVERIRVVEYAPTPPRPPAGEHRAIEAAGTGGYRAARDSPVAGGVLHLDHTTAARRALPPGSTAPARGWRRWLPWL